MRKTWVDEFTGETLTCEVSVLEGFKEFEKNEEFREFLQTGYFIHCENRFVINHPKYVVFNKEGVARLTDYAKKNEKKCCVVFNLVDERGKEACNP